VIAGDQVSVSILVRVPPAEAFRVFTEEIDQWWRHGLKWRVAKDRGIMAIEPKVGGRLFESFKTKAGDKVVQTGTVLAWEPPSRLLLEWRGVNFRPGQRTEVEIHFAPSPSGTMVKLVHRGWSQIPADHPARHGEETAVFMRSMGMWWSDLLVVLREQAETGT